ncbi:hypothetical protein EC988_000036 [Linderina pennispora]|nr:hypothetical protein EC988_000036 [Linderina pennispora]
MAACRNTTTTKNTHIIPIPIPIININININNTKTVTAVAPQTIAHPFGHSEQAKSSDIEEERGGTTTEGATAAHSASTSNMGTVAEPSMAVPAGSSTTGRPTATSTPGGLDHATSAAVASMSLSPRQMMDVEEDTGPGMHHSYSVAEQSAGPRAWALGQPPAPPAPPASSGSRPKATSVSMTDAPPLDPSPEMLHSVLDRVQRIEQYCESLMVTQNRQSRQMEALDTLVRQLMMSNMQTSPPGPAPGLLVDPSRPPTSQQQQQQVLMQQQQQQQQQLATRQPEMAGRFHSQSFSSPASGASSSSAGHGSGHSPSQDDMEARQHVPYTISQQLMRASGQSPHHYSPRQPPGMFPAARQLEVPYGDRADKESALRAKRQRTHEATDDTVDHKPHHHSTPAGGSAEPGMRGNQTLDVKPRVRTMSMLEPPHAPPSGQMQLQFVSTTRGNPEAQPNASWLSSQRHYKNALLHLLTLESFYPSDVAMLNMFRAQGDFSSDQIDAHSAALLSWARSWLRYNRNAVLRSTLENKAKASLTQLAETLQHDMHAETDFTTPKNLRRCALLRLIYFQWQSLNKLGTKSQSMYRDYENRLREIEALPTEKEQEAEWQNILREEQDRRLALIRESSRIGIPVVLTEQPQPQQSVLGPVVKSDPPLPQQPHPHQQQHHHQQQQQQQHHHRHHHQHTWGSGQAAASSAQPSQSSKSPMDLPRRQSVDWQPVSSIQFASPPQQQQQQQQQQHPHPHSHHRQQQQQHPSGLHPRYYAGGPPPAQPSRILPPPSQVYHRTPTPMQQRPHGTHEHEVQRDDDSEMSVNLSPEP